ncbi:unnamed protein product [Schistosoma margrebowiei]|uniref:Uncharacterized protein n=1 Tax=Schistosoma margrebowiei TaxID=48269 RepID=A0A183MQ94_9TREM|nr:unnamed protein product [Schistosoma margrebowiei]
MCKECFSWCFEEEIHWTIVNAKLISRGDKIAIGASGGKDSTVLAYILNLLNKRYDYGAELLLLSIDEGISGYRDDSLMDLYGWSMDDIVKHIGNKRNCSTYCGVFRRQALDKGALLLGANKICTGHNADDIAETVLMNILRGDIGRLKRCTAIMTGTDGILPRFKPFKYAYEKEIVMYAHMHKLDYFSTECKYAPQAYRAFIKDLERIRPRTIIGGLLSVRVEFTLFHLDIIASGERMGIRSDVKMPQKSTCEKCGCISSQLICQACILLEQLNSGLPQITIKDTEQDSQTD